jgi:hypothetical protein
MPTRPTPRSARDGHRTQAAHVALAATLEETDDRGDWEVEEILDRKVWKDGVDRFQVRYVQPNDIPFSRMLFRWVQLGKREVEWSSVSNFKKNGVWTCPIKILEFEFNKRNTLTVSKHAKKIN